MRENPKPTSPFEAGSIRLGALATASINRSVPWANGVQSKRASLRIGDNAEVVGTAWEIDSKNFSHITGLGNGGSTTFSILKELSSDAWHEREHDLPNPYSTPGSPILVGGLTTAHWDLHPSINLAKVVGPGKDGPGWNQTEEDVYLFRSRNGDGRRRGLLAMLTPSRQRSQSTYSNDEFAMSSVPMLGYQAGSSKVRRTPIRGVDVSGKLHARTIVVKLKNRAATSMLDGDSRYPMLKKRPVNDSDSFTLTRPIFISSQPVATPSMNPNLNVKGRPYSINGERGWSSDLVAVCDDNLGPLCLAASCSSVPFSRNKARIDHLRRLNRPLDWSEEPTWSKDCVTHASLSLVCMAWPLQVSNRKAIRSRYDIEGNYLTDLGAVVFCSGCALTQESREIELEEKALLEEIQK